MASSAEYRDYVLEQLAELTPEYKSMMGEFLIYVSGVCFGGIFDNKFLIKIIKTNEKYSLVKDIPYESAKPMYMVENVDNKEYLKELVLDTVKGLKK